MTSDNKMKNKSKTLIKGSSVKMIGI